MYSMWKIMCFFNLKPHKSITLHQIHKIMFFLATSYDPFNDKTIQLRSNLPLGILFNLRDQVVRSCGVIF